MGPPLYYTKVAYVQIEKNFNLCNYLHVEMYDDVFWNFTIRLDCNICGGAS